LSRVLIFFFFFFPPHPQRDAATTAVLAAGVSMDQVKQVRVGQYPCFVRVEVGNQIVWENEQRSLFRKNAEARTKSMAAITAAVKAAYAKM
jgi:adenosyl cobinamide kinase/adenosyl cobinamide phosphate guanylyltransferase